MLKFAKPAPATPDVTYNYNSPSLYGQDKVCWLLSPKKADSGDHRINGDNCRLLSCNLRLTLQNKLPENVRVKISVVELKGFPPNASNLKDYLQHYYKTTEPGHENLSFYSFTAAYNMEYSTRAKVNTNAYRVLAMKYVTAKGFYSSGGTKGVHMYVPLRKMLDKDKVTTIKHGVSDDDYACYTMQQPVVVIIEWMPSVGLSLTTKHDAAFDYNNLAIAFQAGYNYIDNV